MRQSMCFFKSGAKIQPFFCFCNSYLKNISLLCDQQKVVFLSFLNKQVFVVQQVI